MGTSPQERIVHVPSNQEFDSNLKMKHCNLIDLRQDTQVKGSVLQACPQHTLQTPVAHPGCHLCF